MWFWGSPESGGLTFSLARTP
jgi:hypothetical protein